jgi:cardiolipin synthase (CMP-forming)
VSGLLKHIPNLLSWLRLAAAPAVALLLIGGNDRAALGIFAFAGLSDAADGFLAKRFGFATRFGLYLDPAADKLLMLASFLTLTVMRVTPLWLTAIVIGRDLAIVLGVVLAIVLEWPIRIVPLIVGKISTALQIGYVTLALVALSLSLDWSRGLQIVAVATAAATLVSWLGYAQLLFQALMERHRKIV